MNGTNGSKPPQNRTKNKLRNSKIRSLASEGKTQTEIAEEVGMTRSGVSRVLNSEETLRIVAENESRLVRLGHKAISALEMALDNQRDDPQTAVRAAGVVLKAIGLDQKNQNDSRDIRKPFIYEAPDGKQIVMGHATEGELSIMDALGLSCRSE